MWLVLFLNNSIELNIKEAYTRPALNGFFGCGSDMVVSRFHHQPLRILIKIKIHKTRVLHILVMPSMPHYGTIINQTQKKNTRKMESKL